MELWPICQIEVKICDMELERLVFDHILFVHTMYSGVTAPIDVMIIMLTF